jgi:hypothetical protein
MVKYGKEYRKLQLDEWKKYYLDYKKLKQKIKEMKQTLFKDLRSKDIPSPELLSTPLIPDDLNEIDNEKENENEKINDNLSPIYKDEKGEKLKEFIELLIKEFKKSYDFFVGMEKVLIKKMNTHLYTQTSYSAFGLSELSKEMKSIWLTVYLSKCLNAFINDIMLAIKKILKKFDKNFSKIFGIITPHLILQLLSKKNSELEHILQFKIIDEITTISQSNIRELKKFFDQNNDNDKDNIEYRNSFLEKYNDTWKFIEDIDELIYFKTQYRDWIDNVIGRNTVKKGYKYFENDIFNPILSSSYYKDNLLDKFLSTKEHFIEAKNMQNKITNENRRNIILILAQTFFYNSLLTCIFPSIYFYEYIRSFGNQIYNELWLVNFFLFLIIGSTYLFQYLSIFLFYNYTSRKRIKFSYLLSYIFIFIGSIVYIISIISGQSHFKMRALALGISRALIGFGSNPMIGKKYITIYSPRYSLPLISKIYVLVELSGFFIGPCIEALFLFLYINQYCCIFNVIGYYGVIGSITLFIIHYIFFIPPESDNFLIIRNTVKGDVNKSDTQITEPFFEDAEDSQDKEFYRLQKEKNEKKNNKSKLDATKSDEIHIEVNDNQSKENNKTINKSINNTIDSNIDEDKRKEEDNDYYKIMEKAGDMNEIAENYFNNVDIGRYSDLDISNEQKENIQGTLSKMDEYAKNSNFTYIDMIPRTLEDITLKEQKTFGYINRNLIVMIILLFINNLIKENLIVHSSYFMLFKTYKNGSIINNASDLYNDISNNKTKINNNIKNINININKTNLDIISFIDNSNDNNDNISEIAGNKLLEYSEENKGGLQIICLFTSLILVFQLLSIFFIMPFYKINLKFKKNLIIFMIMSVILMIPLSFTIFYEYIFLYVPLVSIDIFIHKIIEVISSCYLVYLIPPKWQYSHIRASSLPIYLMTFGKALGCILCMASFDENYIELNQHILTGIAFFFYGFIGLFIYKSKNFRISTLSRILRQRVLE